MAQGLGRMDRYRTPPSALTRHDAGRWTYGRPWIAALNSGDATGAAYLATATAVGRAERASAVASRGSKGVRAPVRDRRNHRLGGDDGRSPGRPDARLLRTNSSAPSQALERDVLNSGSSYHEMTAILDKVAAGELLGRRQDMATNQLLSHALEQLLARSKRQRDTEASTLNMQLVTWRDGDAANRAFRAGAGDALATWRQP